MLNSTRPFEYDEQGVIHPTNSALNDDVNDGLKHDGPVNDSRNDGLSSEKTSIGSEMSNSEPVKEPVNEFNDPSFNIILKAIRQNPEITIQELSDSIQKSKSTLKRYISKMKSMGILLREGADKNGRWIVRNN